jgi:hypothetical protein
MYELTNEPVMFEAGGVTFPLRQMSSARQMSLLEAYAIERMMEQIRAMAVHLEGDDRATFLRERVKQLPIGESLRLEAEAMFDDECCFRLVAEATGLKKETVARAFGEMTQAEAQQILSFIRTGKKNSTSPVQTGDSPSESLPSEPDTAPSESPD